MTAYPTNSIGRLLAGPMRPGRLEWIGLRPKRRGAMLAPAAAKLIAGHGVEGDHYDSQRNGPRQVTLIAAEDLAATAAFLGIGGAPELLRRNLVVREINLLALKDRQFRVGTALLEGSRGMRAVQPYGGGARAGRLQRRARPWRADRANCRGRRNPDR